MNASHLFSVGSFALGALLVGCSPPEPEISFSADVQPILAQYCAECHDERGEGMASSGFSVHDYDSVMKGTSLGEVVVPGSSPSSTLYLVVAQKTAPEIHMPPHHEQALAEGRGAPLSEEDVGIIQAWIDQGARNN